MDKPTLTGVASDEAPATHEPDPQAVPALRVGIGNAVQIGRATLYLGDCRNVLPTLGPVDMVFTSPPYKLGNTAAGSGGFPNKKLGNYAADAKLGSRGGN